jgi:hypothetical protein
VRYLHDTFRDKRTGPPFDEISRTLECVAGLYSKVFIIVDALDECLMAGGRDRFLSEIFNLQSQCGAKVTATSRFISEVTGRFKASISLERRANKQDVRRYVDGRMTCLPSFVIHNPDLQEEIRTRIVNPADGMYVTRYILVENILTLLGFYLLSFILMP